MSTAAARTALGPMVIVAVEQYEDVSLLRDPVAARLLPSSGRAAVRAARWPVVRRMLVGATERRIPGLWASMVCRKRFIDDAVEAARERVEAVVILGAGFDTRAYRLPALANVPVFEVDLPANIERKRARLTALHGGVPAGVTLVPVDFETQDLAGRLAGHGYRPRARTFFVWEAVTQYLTEAGVRATFAFLSGAPRGSELVFTYVRQDFLDGTALYGAESAYREFVVRRPLWRFGMAPEAVPGFLAEYGWDEVDQVGAREFTDRYLVPAGRAMAVSEIERAVLARKR
ncbi:SAM-dependent methyltransferase [Amycolatopsis sp. CA-230715]|uniref:SAM-dependent methyltransferase n=1 Tax=Amycolatopsis sp. CA-230715 TaxID=2745196 RepID=UPI001C031FC2|nr:SAM-dependent methyltransferase [Amycolatopsis sp. CA-230715]QWF84155.1 hypothetical protein HUW46_07599 [Amycolatopsis sp. CA-230715]